MPIQFSRSTSDDFNSLRQLITKILARNTDVANQLDLTFFPFSILGSSPLSITTLTGLKAIELEMFHGEVVELTPLANLKSLRVLGSGPTVRALTNLEKLTSLHALFLDTPGCDFNGVSRLTGLTYLTLRPVISAPSYLRDLTLLGELNFVGSKNGNGNQPLPNLVHYYTHLTNLRLISLWNFHPFSLQPFLQLSSLIGLALGDIDQLPKEEITEILTSSPKIRAVKITRCKGLPELTATSRAQVDSYLTNLDSLEVYTGSANNTTNPTNHNGPNNGAHNNNENNTDIAAENNNENANENENINNNQLIN